MVSTTAVISLAIILIVIILVLFILIKKRKEKIKQHREELAKQEAIKKAWGLDKSIKDPRKSLIVLKNMASDFFKQYHLKKEKENQIKQIIEFQAKMDLLLY
jgi:flagellar biosynthesis/type III secretory pathway M-ring protein FliF/YscJ